MWRVGLITAVFYKTEDSNNKDSNNKDSNNERDRYFFTGTLLDNYIILTSPNVLINVRKNGKHLISLSIQLEGERNPREINMTNVDIDKMVADHYLNLFLNRPYG